MYINYDAFTPILGANAKERLLEPNRTAIVCDCRRILAASLRANHCSLNVIARTLQRHHTTVLNLLRTHEALLEYDENYRKLVESCGERILVHEADEPYFASRKQTLLSMRNTHINFF
jgi:hypothetical protein